jgi:hypothetical protein
MPKDQKYILITGAPGSKWSSVVKNIYWSDDIDRTDYSKDREYYHEADTPGEPQLMHIGAYWDPGMEFDVDDWDGPFSGQGTRIVKAHTFAHELDRLATLGHPIVMVYRNDVECFEWWKLCGEFGITYPLYNEYYKNLDVMWQHIQRQNRDIQNFIKNNSNRIQQVDSNIALCQLLNINFQSNETGHIYKQKDIKVYVYQ